MRGFFCSKAADVQAYLLSVNQSDWLSGSLGLNICLTSVASLDRFKCEHCKSK
jgi:hypothetical protein